MKPKILVFVKYYLPGFKSGGPVRSISNLVDRLGDEFDFFVVTLDRDAGDDHQYPDIQTRTWTKIGKTQVMYLGTSEISTLLIRKVVKKLAPDVIYLNSFFDPIFTQRVLWFRLLDRASKIPVIMAPRGEFSSGAINLKKWKKKAYLFIARYIGLYRRVIWQASAEHEVNDILSMLRFVGREDIRTASNVPGVIKNEIVKRVDGHISNALKVCFLSRISRMKNLDFALRVLSKTHGRIIFDIYGPKREPDYWDECEHLIARMPDNVRVSVGGEVDPSAVPGVISEYDVLFLPTRGENYGHVIFEALAVGVPVLISDRTPWSHAEEAGAAWVFSLDDEHQVAEMIDQIADLPIDQMNMFKSRAFSLAQRHISDGEAIDSNRALFLSCIAADYKNE